MGRLRTVSLILILGAWGGATIVAAPDDATSATRQPPPAPPIKYLEAGSRLFNSATDGDKDQIEKAAKYLQAANLYRDQLQPDEQQLLDEYLKELGKARAQMAAPPAGPLATAAAAPAQAPPAAARPQSSPRAPEGSQPLAQGGPAGPDAIAPNIDAKQRARWLMHQAYEQMHLGNYDGAQRKADEAESLNVKWGLFEDTPAKVSEEIKKARPKAVATRAGGAAEHHDRRAAKAKLREARNAITDRHFEQAESIALDVKGWGLTYGLFEDNPDKVASAARALRRRDKIRNTPARDQSSQGVYDIMVQESRELVSLGKLDEAEAKARQAQRMNVVPSLTADRAESVLHEIAMARAAKTQALPAAAPSKPADESQMVASTARPKRPGVPAPARPAEPQSLVAEREANELLEKGDQAGATAKFVEAGRLGAAEVSPTAPATAGIELAGSTTDPAVRQSGETDPAPLPDLAAPADPGRHYPSRPSQLRLQHSPPRSRPG